MTSSGSQADFVRLTAATSIPALDSCISHHLNDLFASLVSQLKDLKLRVQYYCRFRDFETAAHEILESDLDVDLRDQLLEFVKSMSDHRAKQVIANKVSAAEAKASWRASSGRQIGGNEYHFGDVFRTFKRSLGAAKARHRQHRQAMESWQQPITPVDPTLVTILNDDLSIPSY